MALRRPASAEPRVYLGERPTRHAGRSLRGLSRGTFDSSCFRSTTPGNSTAGRQVAEFPTARSTPLAAGENPDRIRVAGCTADGHGSTMQVRVNPHRRGSGRQTMARKGSWSTTSANGTETAMPQVRCFQAMEIALKAQALAERS